MNITADIFSVGVNDYAVKLFEGQFKVEKGMAYNSYLIKDNRIAVFDAVGGNFGEEWLNNIAEVLDGRTPDYLIILHAEPDHSANILKFAEKYPKAVVVSSAKAFGLIKNFYGEDFADRRIIVAENDTLDLGAHKLKFFAAPMVHWPEVTVAYDQRDGVLFSADAFGKFGTTDADEDWACEARRYYFGIVGKYGAQVQTLLKKLSDLKINAICALHGPALTENTDYYLGLYNTWSSYGTETDGVFIAYTSVYGHTKAAVDLLAEKLKENGCPKIAVADLSIDDMAEAVEDAFRYGKMVLATTTYNGGIFPFMKRFIDELSERNYKNKTVALIENGSWAPVAAKVMKEMFSKSVNIVFTENCVKILSSVSEENKKEIEELAKELCR
ncbi:MAG: FprA family A-type flavoprotein [Clostridia bacterium]|nr:FprA family A-type flavoprotein [Clostridia bacterium]